MLDDGDPHALHAELARLQAENADLRQRLDGAEGALAVLRLVASGQLAPFPPAVPTEAESLLTVPPAGTA